jgi:NAD(P)-dependent dehydrogenase (short-subunit alcohol dehydrogenase family)
MFELDGRTAWVTGSTKNLGRQMLADLAEQGADIVVSNRTSEEELDETAEALDDTYDVEVLGVQVDIGELDSVEEAWNEIEDEFGGVDILVNNAAIRPHRPFKEMTFEEWEEVLRTNLTGAYLCTDAVLPYMERNNWGRIISISGVDAFFGQPERPHVVTSKAGIIGFSRAVAHEFASEGITANTVVPGTFRTAREGNWEDRYQTVIDRIPVGRLGTPEDLSPMIVFLASEEGSYVTGQTFHVNGGYFPTLKDPEYRA